MRQHRDSHSLNSIQSFSFQSLLSYFCPFISFHHFNLFFSFHYIISIFSLVFTQSKDWSNIEKKPIMTFAIVFVLLLSAKGISGYTFDCLDGCECDTDDEAIHCHNNPDRERVQLPKTRLRGFTVLALTQNNLKVLPGEEVLLEKLPDLKAVDVEGNDHFDCSILGQYSKITVMSDCGKSADELEADRAKLPTTPEPSEDCDVQCVADKRARELREYIKHLWEMIKTKVAKLAKKHGMDKFIDDVGNFFNDVGQRLRNL